MIIFFRIDDRLIHGQIATTWLRHISPEFLIVANDDVAKNSMLCTLQRMSAPKDIPLEICSVNKAIEILNTSLKTKNVFLLVKSIEDAYEISKNVEVNKINIGNIGFKENTINLVRRIFVTKKELSIIEELIDNRINIFAQMVPNESVLSIKKELIVEKLDHKNNLA